MKRRRDGSGDAPKWPAIVGRSWIDGGPPTDIRGLGRPELIRRALDERMRLLRGGDGVERDKVVVVVALVVSSPLM